MTRDERPSKTRRKHDALDAQSFGEALIELSDERLRALPLPDQLRDAVHAARRMTKHGALRRQRQYIGKIMRSIDTEPIRVAMHTAEEVKLREALLFKRVESWRDRLLAEGDDALEALVAAIGPTDVQTLRSLMRAAQRDLHAGKNRGNARALFRALRDLIADAVADGDSVRPEG